MATVSTVLPKRNQTSKHEIPISESSSIKILELNIIKQSKYDLPKTSQSVFEGPKCQPKALGMQFEPATKNFSRILNSRLQEMESIPNQYALQATGLQLTP